MKRMSKFSICIFTVWLFLCVTSVTVNAFEANIDSYAQEFDFQSVADAVSSETASILSEMGIDEISFEKIFSVQISKIFTVLFDVSKRSLSEPVKFLASSMGIIILITVVSSFLKNQEIVYLIGASFLALCAAVPVANAVTTAFSVLETLNAFTSSFAGVFCALVSSSGNIALGTSYASLAVLSDSLFAALLSGVSQPAVNAMCSLSFLSCFDVYAFSARLSGIVKKLYVSFLGFVATFFSGIVTLKGVMGVGADSLTSRGIRFVVGHTVPIVGGTVSDTYSALISSLSLIKNTVGVFGIITVVLTVLPSLLEMLSWVFVLGIVIVFSEFSGAKYSVGMLYILKDALTLLVATTVFSAVIFIVSVGVVIFVKGV